ncbi:MAG TPA: hypothetical protein VIZ22_14005 [Candidatus Limnocylindrales bacterium]
MTTDDDLDRQIQAYLESGPAELTDRVLWAARAQLKTTRRRRSRFAWLAPWRNRHMTQNTRLGLVGAGVLVVAIGASLFGSILTRPNPEPAPVGSPAAQVDASAPANSVQAPPSSGEPAPSASASLQPTPTPDPEAVRTTAAAGYLAAAGRATDALVAATPRGNPADTRAGAKAEGRRTSEAWGLFVTAMKQLEVPADTKADLRALIRKATAVQELYVTQPPADGTDAWWSFRREVRNKFGKYEAYVTKVRADLGLPAYCWEPSVCGEDGPPF